jgi:hypothetical protein
MPALIPFPELPNIEDFTQGSQTDFAEQTCEWDDNERLAELGVVVLNNVVILHFFLQCPLLRADEIWVSFVLPWQLSDFIRCADLARTLHFSKHA